MRVLCLNQNDLMSKSARVQVSTGEPWLAIRKSRRLWWWLPYHRLSRCVLVALLQFLADVAWFRCTGQIELYTHFPIMTKLVELLTRQLDIRLCATYLLESQFMEDRTKFFSGVMSAMSCMINLECPHINILSKMDLVKGGKSKRELSRFVFVLWFAFEWFIVTNLNRFVDPDPTLLSDEVNARTNPKFHALNEAIVRLVSLLSSLLLYTSPNPWQQGLIN